MRLAGVKGRDGKPIGYHTVNSWLLAGRITCAGRAGTGEKAPRVWTWEEAAAAVDYGLGCPTCGHRG